VTNLEIFSSRRAITKTVALVLIIVALVAVLVPLDLWYSSFQDTANKNTTPSPTNSSSTISLTPTPTTQPTTTSKATASPTATPHPTYQPISTPYPPTTPTPTYPPPGTGPSTTETIVNETPATVQNLLGDLSPDQKSTFSTKANATLGNWTGNIVYSPLSWMANGKVSVGISVNISKEVLTTFLAINKRIDNSCVLVTAERDYDSQGNQHVPWDNTVSTILTPSGLPIEAGGSAAISRYNGYTRRSPVDVMIEVPYSSFDVSNSAGWVSGSLYGSFTLPNNLPPGIYRLRLDFGFRSGTKYIDFNNATIGTRPTYLNSISCVYSPPILSSGWDVNGTWVDASQIIRKPYWDLLWDYNSNGYRGVVASEDQKLVAISPRSIIHDTVILPKVDVNGNLISYNIEPNFLLNNDNTQRNIPMNYRSGQWTAKVTLPNGTVLNLGTANFAAQRGNGATTQNSTFTAWKPPTYGNYSIEASGWILDAWGNRYQGGGNYTFWIGNRLTVATATFQGMPYNVGNRYGRDLALNPPVPANVTMKAQLFLNSDPNNVTTVVSSGVATRGGIWGAAQGMVPLLFPTPGEYFGTVTATYVDPGGVLWVAAMTHAGVVYPTDSSIVAHGKKLQLPNGTLVDRGQTKKEGYTAPNGTLYLQHINFPYNFSDVLEIATEFQASNKIEPVLSYSNATNPTAYDPNIQGIGKTNIVTKTSNNLSPEMFPEFITDLQYFYGAGAQPGFNARFIVAYDYTRAPYWPTSNTNFGGQYGASNNGDMPGTIYRLLGGVVLRNKGQTPNYAGYQATAFILPKGTNNNRIIGPGDENLPGPDNTSARFFLVPIRPGSTYPIGATFTPVLQIDPILPCNVTFTLTAPNNTTYVSTGKGDQYGYFAGSKGFVLNQTGVWTYIVNATWNGYQGHVPGLPNAGGWIYVIENGTPPGPGITMKMPMQQTFSPTTGLNVTGQTTASKIFYAIIIPGAVLEQGILPVNNGTFTYYFNPQAMASKIQTYDIIYNANGQAQIGKIVHLSFFSEESATDGTVYHSFARVVLRGTTAVYVKER
jgi:hypothetical protein